MPKRMTPQRKYAKKILKLYKIKGESLDAMIKKHKAKAKVLLHH